MHNLACRWQLLTTSGCCVQPPVVAITTFDEDLTSAARSDELAKTTRLVSDLGLSFPVAIAGSNDLNKSYMVYGLPSTALVNENGRIVAYGVGDVGGETRHGASVGVAARVTEDSAWQIQNLSASWDSLASWDFRGWRREQASTASWVSSGFLPSSAGINGTLRDGRGFDQAGSIRHTLLFFTRTCCRTLASLSCLELEER